VCRWLAIERIGVPNTFAVRSRAPRLYGRQQIGSDLQQFRFELGQVLRRQSLGLA
jgi:hypothetical protein